MGDRRTSAGGSRRRFVGSIGSLCGVALAGCLGPGSGADREADGDETTERDSEVTAPPTADRSLPEAYEPDELADESLSGGPGQDGIPSIDDPQFRSASDPPAALEAADPVFGVELNGDARAYPQYVLVWHEIVNDVVGDEAVAVTYCPLTGTAQGFYRGATELGVSGRLVNSNLIMYDRGSETRWSQVLARGIRGPLEGAYLEECRVIWTTWERWREQHPETAVLSEDTGYLRDYGDDPYGGYNPPSGYYDEGDALFRPLTADDRFPAKDVVVGSRTADGAIAIPKATLRERTIVEGTAGDVPYVTVYDEGLDTAYVYRNPDDESVEVTDGRFSVRGDAYEPYALPLERTLAFDAMWFAWYGFYPSTEVHE